MNALFGLKLSVVSTQICKIARHLGLILFLAILHFLRLKVTEAIRRRLKGLASTVRPRPHDIDEQITIRPTGFRSLGVAIFLRNVTSPGGLPRRTLRSFHTVVIHRVLQALGIVTKDTRIVPGNSPDDTITDIDNSRHVGIDESEVEIKETSQKRKLILTRHSSRNVGRTKWGIRWRTANQVHVGYLDKIKKRSVREMEE
jgi:hypothetical protein